ncbi:hypothetical protein Cst_c18740 [Thermoclostridium stercorarium subsp. stercorarium DSM 8532]|uniref:Uncharacterized protein n=1 Tax=Thermoclostridium stercorarium (strain ATCC 35414 / DSM 8532 / NCIMB 11754) TaxID=1121335 RepID=L7VR21_THES1|nr:hypothetical protein Cst_c18740 [Thermoclostridium stercorarium subsp. stercorarium DSM 8532]
MLIFLIMILGLVNTDGFKSLKVCNFVYHVRQGSARGLFILLRKIIKVT